jgi:dihydrofolate reductase
MTTGHVFMAMSLDGFVAREDNSLDWLMKQGAEGEDTGFAEFEASNDCIIMGSESFRTILGFDDWVYTKPAIVMSSTMTKDDIPKRLDGKVTITELAPADLMQSLHAKGWNRAYVDGGKVVQSFLREGLIADLVVTIALILVGRGKRLFGETVGDIDLQLVDSKAFGSGLVSNTYRVIP